MSAKKRSKPSVPLSDVLLECSSLLRFFQSKPEAEPFLAPVDWQLYGLTDYPDVIKVPMDLGTVENKLHEGRYKDPNAFGADFRLVFDNCMKYNRPDSDLYSTAEKLMKQFDKKFQKIKAGGSAIKKTDGSDAPQATRADRLKFSQLVNQLAPDQLGTIIEMLKKDCPAALNEDEEDEIEIEINLIDGPALGSLIAFANQCIAGGSDANKKIKLK